MRHGVQAAIGLCLLLLPASQAGAVTMRIYHIGNSLTDEVKYDQFMGLAQSRGHTHIWGRQMIPGAPLGWNWNHPGEGFTKAPYGGYYTALTGYDWDALVLQPFQWGYRTEADYANRFAGLALRHHEQTTIYIHMTWPANNVGSYGEFEAQWLSGPEATNRSRAYFEFVADSVAATFGADMVRVVPNGEVMYTIDQRIRSATFPLMGSVWEFYADGIHLNDKGKYLVAGTHYAVIYQDDPVGLPTTGYSVESDLAAAIQQVIREVVLAYPRAGVSSLGPYAVNGVSVTPAVLELNRGRTATLAATLSPGNATNRAITWTSLNPAVATIDNSGAISTVSAGAAMLVVATEDGDFRDTCMLSVTGVGTPVDAVSITPDADTILVSATAVFDAAVLPAGATNTTLVWHTLDTSVATVDANGSVSGRARGQTRLVVTTVNGALRDTARIVVSVANNPPTAVLDATPIDGYVDTYFKFSAMRSSDPDPDDFVLGFDWDFGDGTAWNYGSTPYHIYTQTGNYTVRLRVMDYNYARSEWVEQPVTVQPRYPGILLYEGFEAPAQRLMGGMAGGYGWYNSSYSSNNASSLIADASRMHYRDLKVRGNYLNLGAGGYRMPDARGSGELGAYITSPGLGKQDSVLWLSVLMRKEQNNDTRVFLRLHPSKFDCCDPNYVEIGYLGASSNDGGQRYWSVSMNGTLTRGPVPLTVGTTSLLVARLAWASGGLTVDLYVDPEALGADAPALPAFSATRDEYQPLQSIGFRSSGTNEASFDELRIGTSFAVVTPTEAVAASQDGSIGFSSMFPRLRSVRGGLEISGIAGEAVVELLDISGRMVRRGVPHDGSVSLASLRPGVYALRISTPQGRQVQPVVLR